MANLFSSLEVGSDVYIPRYRLKEYQQENEAASRKLCDASLGVGHNTVETALDLGGKPLYFLLDQGKTALHFACTRNDVESVEMFLSIYVKESVGKEGEENQGLLHHRRRVGGQQRNDQWAKSSTEDVKHVRERFRPAKA